MSNQQADNKDDMQTSERKLRCCVEKLLNGKIITMERQQRWRPAWFLELEQADGKKLNIHIRGDRESDVMPFPELKREADILTVLEQQGIPVPHIYGMCDDPVAIIMETVPGTRDVSLAASDAERRSIARQYIDALAAMHRVPLEPFVDIGVRLPKGAKEIALVGLDAYMPLYKKHKQQPDPLIEFAISWLQNNVPTHRVKPAFIAFDAGQFLFEHGKITALYDFEFSMIGDPLTDLATMAMRQSVEHMGEEIDALLAYYGEVTGEPVDISVVRYHHALFATVACMQFVGSTTNPQAGDPHDVYVEWDLALRRSLINVLLKNVGVQFNPPEVVNALPGKHKALLTMLDDSLDKIEATSQQQQNKTAAQRLIEYYAQLDRVEEELERLARSDAQLLLKSDYCPVSCLDQQIEQFIVSAKPDSDKALISYLATQVERKVQVFSGTSIGLSAAHVRLENMH
jgi:aminoglycoside phosphotransferase (APT) family kinase protein